MLSYSYGLRTLHKDCINCIYARAAAFVSPWFATVVLHWVAGSQPSTVQYHILDARLYLQCPCRWSFTSGGVIEGAGSDSLILRPEALPR